MHVVLSVNGNCRIAIIKKPQVKLSTSIKKLNPFLQSGEGSFNNYVERKCLFLSHFRLQIVHVKVGRYRCSKKG